MAFSFTDYMRQAQPFDYTSPFASGGPSSGLDALAGDLTAKNPLLGQLAFSPAPLSQLLTDPQWLNAQGKAALKAASDTGQPPDLGNQNTSAASGGAGASGSYTLGAQGDPNVLRWKSQIEFASQKTGVPDYIIAAEMDFESGGNPDAVSPAGAQGLMQVMPQYHAARASKYGYSLGDPQGNILAGADYLAELHQKAISLGYNGDDAWKAAFGGYLTGDVNWQRDGNQTSDAFGSTAGSYSATVQGKIEKYRTAVSAPTNPAEAAPQGALQTAIGIAEKYEGQPYVWGGSDPSAGFDCSGLVQYAYGQAGIKLPRTAQAQYDATARVDANALKPGDLVFFTGTYDAGVPVTHVGIYIGNGQMLDSQSAGIRVDNLSDPYWKSHLYSYGRAS